MARVAVIQTTCRVGNIAENLAIAEDLVAEAGRRKADLACLPELFTTGYVPDRFAELAEPIPGPSTDRLAGIAQKARLFLVAGVLERDPATGLLHNASVLISPDGQLRARYRKVFLYLGEREVLAPGSAPCVLDVGFCKLALVICYDYVFPEYIRYLVDRGAQLLVHPTAWLTTDACQQWHYPRTSCRTLGVARALENTVFFMSANHSGNYDQAGALRAVGQSSVIAPWGEVLAEVQDGQGLAVADVDFAKCPQWRDTAAPYLSDRARFSWEGT